MRIIYAVIILPTWLVLACFLCPIELWAGDSIQQAGDILQLVIPGAAASMTIVHHDLDGAIQLVESETLTLGVTYGLKYTVNERRPNGGKNSFPSGHTSVAFSSAEFMRKRYGWEYGLPAYALASFVAYSRVESREHYAHDVIAGAGIGILSSYLFTKRYDGWNVHLEGDNKNFNLLLSRSW
jgi:membrane-associated phospholipid phosphatase